MRVKAPDLIPRQRLDAKRLKRRTDWYERVMIKHPTRSLFHSLAELYHAALLEANADVISYVPQPYSLLIGSRRYIPDCFVFKNDERVVIELKPRGEMDSELEIPLQQFFKSKGMRFLVVPNEWALEQSLKAENWLTILSVLVFGNLYETADQESRLLDRFFLQPNLNLGDVIDPGNRLGCFYEELSLFRLIHQGHLAANLDSSPLDYDTEISLCM